MQTQAANDPWARVVQDMITNARKERRRWERAAFDAAKAANPDVKYPSLGDGMTEAAIRTVGTLRRLSKDIKRLEMMLALEVAGRDMAHLNDEIVRCIDKNGANMQATIIRRLFQSGLCDIDYYWTEYIERRIEKMRKADRLGRIYGSGRTQTKWYVVTTEVIESRKAAKRCREKHAAAEAVRKSRQAAVVELLRSQGYESAHPGDYDDSRVILSVTDMEKMLGL